MSFRAELIKMVECHVSIIDHHKYKITDVMKTHFVSFINEFFKCHVGSTDIDYKLTPNFLYAEMDDIRVMIATDASKEFKIPGMNISMREPVEAFILIGESVCYDSVLMRRFRHVSACATVESFPTYVGKIPPTLAPIVENETSREVPVSAPASIPTAPALTFNPTPTTPALTFNPTPSTPALTFNPIPSTPAPPSIFTPAPTAAPPMTFSTPPATPSAFNFSSKLTNTPSTFSTFPSPATSPAPSMFNSQPSATLSSFSTPPVASSGFNFTPKPAVNPFNTFSAKTVNTFGRADSVSSIN
jgi:hypothetical protein